jgi:hypothetical protein
MFAQEGHRVGAPSDSSRDKLHDLKQIEFLDATDRTKYFRVTAGELRAASDPR